MSHFDRSQAIVACLTFVLTLIFAVDAAITVPPKDVEATLGISVIFNCSSSIPGTDIQWIIYPIGRSMKVIYAFGKINSDYANRFAVRNGHNLHISSVTLDDAGTYECQDDYGHGEKQQAELIVLESNPTCRSNSNLVNVVGKNTCGIEPGQVILSCIVQFRGKKVPALIWKKHGEEKAITSGIRNEIRGSLIVHNLTIEGDSITNGSSFICRPATAASPETSCNAGPITIIGETVDATTYKCESCQSYRNTNVFLVVWIIVTHLFYALAAGVLWHLFIPYPKLKNNEGRMSCCQSVELPLHSDEHPTVPETTLLKEPVKAESELADAVKTKSSKCKLSKDAIIFGLLMAIPLCIGLFLWFLIFHRRTQRKNRKILSRTLTA